VYSLIIGIGIGISAWNILGLLVHLNTTRVCRDIVFLLLNLKMCAGRS